MGTVIKSAVLRKFNLAFIGVLSAFVTLSVANAQSVIDNAGFDDGLVGWEAEQSGGASNPGNVTIVGGQALLQEGDSFLVTLRQGLAIPSEGLAELSTMIDLSPGFDLADPFIPDAFEVSILNLNNESVVPTWRPLATSFFNVQEDGTINLAPGARFESGVLTVDLSAAPPGETVTLIFDLIGGDEDTNGAVAVDNVTTVLSNIPPLALAGGPYTAECEGALTSVTLDASDSSDGNDDPLDFSWIANGIDFDDPTSGQPTGGFPLGTTNVTLEVSDPFVSIATMTEVRVEDTRIPQLSPPADLTVECTDPEGTPVSVGQATADDVCCGSDVSIAADAPANFFLGESTVLWQAEDCAGNPASASQSVTVEDTTPPDLEVPSGLTLECNTLGGVNTTDPVVADWLAEATASDVCADFTLADSVSGVLPVGETEVVFTATDGFGNSATLTSTVEVTDAAGPSIVCPADVELDCPDPLPSGEVGATGQDTCSIVSIDFADTSVARCGVTQTVDRVWTAEDLNGNTSDCSQTIAVVDESAPTLTGVPADVTVECDAIPAVAIVTAEDTCDSEIIAELDEVVANDSCSGGLVRTWTATDDCGNTTALSQTISTVDSNAPAGGIVSPTTQQCLGGAVTVIDSYSDSCDANLDRIYSPGPGPIYDAHGDYTVDLTVRDDCGNASTSSVQFSIDRVPPQVTPRDDPGETILVPKFLPINIGFDASDHDGVSGDVIHERVTLDGCLVYDGLVYGDGDGLLSDEKLELSWDGFCQLAETCQFGTLELAALNFEARDCADNLGLNRWRVTTPALPIAITFCRNFEVDVSLRDITNITWEDSAGDGQGYTVYRGTISSLHAGDYGSEFASVSHRTAEDLSIPEPGDGWFYLVERE